MEIEITMDTPNGPVVEYGPDDDAAEVEATCPVGWSVDFETPAVKLASGRFRSPLVRDTAERRLASLTKGRERIEVDAYEHEDGTILVATLVGDPDSEGEEYYSNDVAVAWDADLDDEGERVGSCYVEASELSTWLSLRWPCTIGGSGFARDGQWYDDGRDAVRS